jgi:hypothetical protein
LISVYLGVGVLWSVVNVTGLYRQACANLKLDEDRYRCIKSEETWNELQRLLNKK